MLNKNYLRILYLDLTTQRYVIREREDLLKYLGGVGLATKLLSEELNPKDDALDLKQPIIFAIGPLSTIFPVATKGVAMFKSPLTSELGESYAGGRFAFSMFLAGYDGLVITGQSAKPVYLSINGSKVSFRDARPLWGLSVEETGRLMREEESGSGTRSTLRIGPAGEKGVKLANVNVDTYRHFGRLGLGALFGSKKLKGMIITGQENYPIPDWPKYNQAYEAIFQKVTSTDLMEKYHDLGTAGNVLPMDALNSLPTYNLQKSTFEKAENISGESFAENHLSRKIACTGCPIGCIHIGYWREQFAQNHEFEMLNIAYDYELIFSLGSYLGLENTQDILKLIEKVESNGLDAISTGIALGWATEALEKGLISPKDTIIPLAFGQPDLYLQAIEYLTERKNDFYSLLGEGTWLAAQKYGGQEFAALMGKLEMAGYHTGYASILGQTVGARHSHLDNAGYSIDQSMKEFDKEKIINYLIQEESERCILNSLTICLFARKVYDLETVQTALSSLGIEKSPAELLDLGKQIFALKLQLKEKMGFDLKQIKFPKRYFETPTLHGVLEEEIMQELLESYQQKASQLVDLFPFPL